MIAEYAENIQLILRSLPEEPGVYQYYDEEGNVLYVGKAKNLKKRVSSYFTKEHETARLRLLLRKIRDIKTIVVASESDALFLENNLIKEFQPRYNVNLKDDKTYPWVCIKKENFPRIFSTRNFIKDGSEYFGPYASVKVMYAVLDLIRSLFPLRTCSLNLTKENIEAGKFRTCLEYHIGRCKAPCVNYQSEEEYMEGIRLAKNILRGNFSGVLRDMKNQMQVLSSDLQFEAAQKIKDKIDLLEKYQSRSTLVSSSVKDAEVYSIISDEIKAYVNFLKIKDGAVIQGLTYEIKKKLEEEDEEL
ncbi:MAG: excinuclease ABC subunit UvrC, partial [Bacteroidota bacterium]